jgi:hypothetical protein
VLRQRITQNSDRNSESEGYAEEPAIQPGPIRESRWTSKTPAVFRPCTRAADQPLPEDVRRRLKLRKGATWEEAAVVAQDYGAWEGDTAAHKELREPVEGKATLRMELTGDEGGPIEITDARLPVNRSSMLSRGFGVLG